MELINNLKFVWKYAKGQKQKLIIFIFSSIIKIIISVLGPILSAKIIIELTSNNYIQIILIAFAIMLFECIYNLFDYIGRRCSLSVYRKVLSLLETDLARSVLKLENNCLDENGNGVFIQRMTVDTGRLSDSFSDIIGMLSDFISYIGVLIAIFLVNKIAFVYVIGILVILWLIEKIRTLKVNDVDKVARKASERTTGFIGELVRGARDIKMLNSENDFIYELSNRVDESNYLRMKMKKKSWNYKLLSWQLETLFYFILIILLVFLLKEEIILPSIALVLYNYSNRVNGLIYLVGNFMEYLKDFNLSCTRIYEILVDDKFKHERFGTKHLEKIHGDFEFKDVTFGYKDKRILNKLNFKIDANSTVAFVGKSGSGKTTIFNLLCKMYDIESGSITIDGIDIRELDKDSIRGNITVISQNPYIFNMSIRDNLKLVKRDLTENEMKKACKMACLDDFIKELPDGYDTIIGEGGVNLSGGQKQRLAIARALVQKTEIILFDEATSALDNETQDKIQKAIENMKNEYTILIIAHRLSTIINSDKIMLLDNGKIECTGTHRQLLETSEKYRKLYETELLDDKNNN